MKCPDCGDSEQQERLGSDTQAAGQARYRCRTCDRLYSVPADIADLTHYLAEMKAQFHALGREMGSLARQIEAAEVKLLELRSQPSDDEQKIEGQ